MKRMIAYGFWKSWRTRRLFLLICAAASLLLIPAAGTIIARHWNAAVAFCYTALFAISVMLMIAPLIWAVSDYIHGISGTRGVLERAVAVPAWQKLLARLIVSLVTIVALALLGFAILAGAAAVTVSGYSSLNDMWREFTQSSTGMPIMNYLLRGGAWGLALGVFQIAKLLLLIYFAIALAKSFPGSRKLSVIVIIAVCVVYSILSSMAAQLLAQVPIYTFTLSTPPQELQSIVQMDGSIESFPAMTVSLSGILANAALAVLAFFGTAWLMENRVEG